MVVVSSGLLVVMEQKVTQVVRPEWVRLPPSVGRAVCPISSLSRSALKMLILPCAQNAFKPLVLSRVAKVNPQGRGVRLINVASLLAWIESQGGEE